MDNFSVCPNFSKRKHKHALNSQEADENFNNCIRHNWPILFLDSSQADKLWLLLYKINKLLLLHVSSQ